MQCKISVLGSTKKIRLADQIANDQDGEQILWKAAIR